MMEIMAGRPLVELICLSYKADRPLLLHGRHGVGKSEMFSEAANTLGVGILVRDLSLMEPPDLIGIPQVTPEGSTRYAMPSFLPSSGEGLLIFEELNRCPRYMQAPCLQLLTARMLNDYRLPGGWLPCAAVNDASEGYHVEELDEAILSRFLRVRVVPDVHEWSDWAQERGGIHQAVIDFVRESPGIFRDCQSNPRAWSYASDLLTTWEKELCGEQALFAGLAGLVGQHWAVAFMKVYRCSINPIPGKDILKSYDKHRDTVKRWVHGMRLDLITATVELVKRHLHPEKTWEGFRHEKIFQSNLRTLLLDLPAEIRVQLHHWLIGRGWDALDAAIDEVQDCVVTRSRSKHVNGS